MTNVFLQLAFLSHAMAQPICLPPEDIKKILALGSVYIGEVHGTNEAPNLIRCLVAKAVSDDPSPVTVSLELPPDARDQNARFWKENRDGRASEAMFSLVQYLKDQEQAGRVRVHYQTLPGDGRTDNNDERAGREIAEMAAHGRVIALSGNIHSRHYDPTVKLRPTGNFVGAKVQSVALLSNDGGTVWACIDSICATHDIPKASTPRPLHVLIDGAEVNHNWIFVVDSFSASLPHALSKDASE